MIRLAPPPHQGDGLGVQWLHWFLKVWENLNPKATTVAGLPSAATAGAGARLFVTDATATTFATIVAGGGANKVPVYSDGTNWLIG